MIGDQGIVCLWQAFSVFWLKIDEQGLMRIIQVYTAGFCPVHDYSVEVGK